MFFGTTVPTSMLDGSDSICSSVRLLGSQNTFDKGSTVTVLCLSSKMTCASPMFDDLVHTKPATDTILSRMTTKLSTSLWTIQLWPGHDDGATRRWGGGGVEGTTDNKTAASISPLHTSMLVGDAIETLVHDESARLST